MVPGRPARHPAQRPARRRHSGRVQPGAVYARSPRRTHRGVAARERAGHRAGAGHARLLGDVDRPRQRIGRSGDRERYMEVNRKFADAVVEEAKTSDPIVLVQDYHFALLPRMIRDKLPDATIITFWHTPWPNPEAFGICPWREELLDGLLGSSILGFHTQFHCNNFVDTVDRTLEARVGREAFTVTFRGRRTAGHRHP